MRFPRPATTGFAQAQSRCKDGQVDGIHDLGGRLGFGPVQVEPDEPVFHQRWEALARGLVYAVRRQLVQSSGAAFRHAIERMDPAHYLSSSYYEHWLTAAATLAVEGGLLESDELERRAGGVFPLARPARFDGVDRARCGHQRFALGDRVRVRDWHPRGHTRCPNYVRGHVGRITRCDGRFSLPDLEAHTGTHLPEATYSVRFAADELWRDGQLGTTVNVDLWDSYLEPA
jgi:nitrile hydratase